MTPVSLYRKWRPRTFQDVVAQEHITTTLRNAIRTGRVAHAYLFTGPRGTGKTTTARLFAKAINCTDLDETRRPCNACEICVSINEGRDLDLIEIDAASNNSVDDVRELRERVGYAPGQSRYKVYIVDEVHMLSGSAFNALLKTLEEPPAHVIFILATTEVDKLPATVLSRCQRFDFRLAPFRVVRDLLASIAQAEGAQIEPGALDLFARLAGGSLRDGISLLDQMIAYGDGHVSLQQTQDILGSVTSQLASQVAQAIAARDVPRGLSLINDAISGGADPRQFTREMLEYLRGVLLLRGGLSGDLLNQPPEIVNEMRELAQGFQTAELLGVLRKFTEASVNLRSAPPGGAAQLPIEMAFVESALRDLSTEKAQSAETASSAGASRSLPATHATQAVTAAARGNEGSAPITNRSSATPPAPAKTVDRAADEVEGALAPDASAPEQSPAAPPSGAGTPAVDAGALTVAAVQERWSETLAGIKAKNRNLEAILKAGSVAAVEGDTVVLSFPYDFHKQKADDVKSRRLIEEELSVALRTPLRVRCEIGKVPERKPAPLRPKDTRQKAMEDPLVKEVVTRYNARIAAVDDGSVDGR